MVTRENQQGTNMKTFKEYLIESSLSSFRVTFATKDTAPDDVPYYEPTFVRAADVKAARGEANKTIEGKHKKYITVDTIKRKK